MNHTGDLENSFFCNLDRCKHLSHHDHHKTHNHDHNHDDHNHNGHNVQGKGDYELITSALTP